ncbi:MAG: PEP/pyruvate-binding domain-containing protein [Pseudomonadota bacterium]
MGRLSKLIRQMFQGTRKKQETCADVDELRAAFKQRYGSFRLLLSSNSRALEVMTDIEAALQGNRVFGMSFVRSGCTAASVNVYKIIKYLNELAPGKYSELSDRFKLIESHINELLSRNKPVIEGPLTIPLAAVDNTMVDLVGAKMANLGVIKNRLGLRVPQGFVITAAAYRRFMEHNDLKGEIRHRMQSRGTESLESLQQLCVELQRLIAGCPIPAEIESAIEDAYRKLDDEAGPQCKVSVRSSALGEDIAGRAFAGQFRSELNVSAENIVHAYKQVVASRYGLAATSYRLNRGIPDESIVMCVGVMAMVCSVAGGVMYSQNPMHPEDPHVIIHSVWGLPKGVVDGTVTSDVLLVNRTNPPEIRSKEVGGQKQKFVCYPQEGVRRVDLDADSCLTQSISDDQALDLAQMGISLERSFGASQDIEWCVGPDNTIYILQSRPLQLWQTAVERGAEPREDSEPPAVIMSGGIVGSPGAGSGRVFVVTNEFDKLSFPEGGVLVVQNALPTWTPLISRASAVVAEVGSMAGHFANVAREFHVPALFGIPDATRRLAAGREVTVDADCMRVIDGRVESLLAERESPRKLMEGSPVLCLLESVAGYIIPLNLTEPDSPDFHPKKCRTYHDITRFAHEVSVREMFNFGKQHHFTERSSKRLMCEVPMQWWVIDLEDGFREPEQSKMVNIENIASVPMLALWRGITAIPWQGPPRMDAGGFMSVLMQSTTNPAMDPAVHSSFSSRNYFMISKSFCSLMSRFGYHFSTVEALVGERSAENYIGFTFKGGAADMRRRARRAHLLAGILKTHGFRANVKEDSLSARVDNAGDEYMKTRLVILGYLIMHTRQIDMVMGSATSVNAYRNKLTTDIESLMTAG